MKKLLILLIFLQGMLMGAQIKHLKYDGIDIPVVFEEQKSLPTFNLQLVFKNSGNIQDGNKPGLASLTSKVFNEGTLKDGSVEFANKLDSLAISLNASHGFETFVFELSSLKDVYKDGLNLFAKLLKDPNYSKDTLEKIKTITTGALKRKENDYDYVAKNQLKKLIFENTPLEQPTSGTIESISKIKLNDVKEFANNNLILDNLIIVAGGDISLDELKKSIKPLLKSFNKKSANKIKTFKASSLKKVEILEKETQQAYIYFGSPFNTKVSNKDNYKVKVASFVLGGSGFGSRLMEEIRVKRGLAYSAYGYVSINKSHSFFNGYLQTKNETSNEAKELVQNIVDEFVKKGITSDELKAAKRFLTGSEPLRVETLSQRLNRSFTLFYRGLAQDYSSKELEDIENLTLKDINSFIKSHDEIKNLSFSIVRK